MTAEKLRGCHRPYPAIQSTRSVAQSHVEMGTISGCTNSITGMTSKTAVRELRGTLKLELQTVVSCPRQVLGIELGPSAKTVCTFNHWCISPAPGIKNCFFNFCLVNSNVLPSFRNTDGRLLVLKLEQKDVRMRNNQSCHMAQLRSSRQKAVCMNCARKTIHQSVQVCGEICCSLNPSHWRIHGLLFKSWMWPHPLLLWSYIPNHPSVLTDHLEKNVIVPSSSIENTGQKILATDKSMSKPSSHPRPL